MFVKISGVKDGNIQNYRADIKYKLSPLTKVIRKRPDAQNIDFTRFFTSYKAYFYDKKINLSALKASPYNKYGFLSDPLQDLIFEKIQETALSGYLNLEPVELMLTVIHVGLNIEKDVIKILQKFDYTKDIPKIIVIDEVEDVFSKTECARLVLYNMLCFDIAVFTPTGYRNLEKHVSGAAFETYRMNEFAQNAGAPNLKLPASVPGPRKGGLFGRRG
jgi:hypothetical protein